MKNELIFEDIFNALITESQKIVIEYDYKVRYYKEESYATYHIDKVNEESPSFFKFSIQKYAKEGLTILNDELRSIDYECKLELLEEIKHELLGLKENTIGDEIMIHEEDEHGSREEYRFKVFKNAILKPVSEERTGGHKKSIQLKASEYVVSWIEVIDETVRKIEFLTNQIELLPQPKEVIKDKNTVRIFYSWQSDNNDERRLIWKALNAIEKHFKGSDKTVEIESDMRGTPGSQDIPNTLFKKIETSDIFIADVNFVNKGLYKEDKLSPNSNVLIELGYAASKLGWNRIVLVFNNENNKIEDLPFDIRQRAVLWYSSVEQLTEKLKHSIGLIIKNA